MYRSTFTQGAFDDRFHTLDQVIAQVLGSYGDGGTDHPLAGRTLPGFGRVVAPN
jgi:hypothetical protein